jgi:hypothetical protein
MSGGSRVDLEPTSRERTLFFITQLGAKGSLERRRADEVEKYILSVAREAFGLEVIRSDKEPTPGQITSQIVRRIVDSTVIVADLTGGNANVFYELGIAHAFGRPVILLVKSVNAVPFDVHSERMIVIGDADVIGASEAEDASKRLRQALSIVLEPGYVPRSLVTDVAEKRSIDALAPGNPLAAELRAIRAGVETIRATVEDLRRTRDEESEFLQDEAWEPETYARERSDPDAPTVIDLMATLEASLAAVREGKASSGQNSRQKTFEVGEPVEHPKFGIGTVQEIIGMGDAAEAIIDFESAGTKRLLLAWSPLRPIVIPQDDDIEDPDESPESTDHGD